MVPEYLFWECCVSGGVWDDQNMTSMLTRSSLKLLGLIWNVHTYESGSPPLKPSQASPLAGGCQSLNAQTSPVVNITMYF